METHYSFSIHFIRNMKPVDLHLVKWNYLIEDTTEYRVKLFFDDLRGRRSAREAPGGNVYIFQELFGQVCQNTKSEPSIHAF